MGAPRRFARKDVELEVLDDALLQKPEIARTRRDLKDKEIQRNMSNTTKTLHTRNFQITESDMRFFSISTEDYPQRDQAAYLQD